MDTANDKLHPALPELIEALCQLHYSLVEVTRMEYERDHSLTLTPVELLHRLVHEPFFQWLRPLSELIIDLHAATSQANADMALDARSARREVENFLSATNFDFWQFYEQHENKPRVAMAFGTVRQALQKLPGSSTSRQAAAMHEREPSRMR